MKDHTDSGKGWEPDFARWNRLDCSGFGIIVVRIALFAFAVLLSLFALEKPAMAYTDPGTGALVWQMVAAGFVGAAFYFRRFLIWFKRKKGVPDQNADQHAEETPPEYEREIEPRS